MFGPGSQLCPYMVSPPTDVVLVELKPLIDLELDQVELMGNSRDLGVNRYQVSTNTNAFYCYVIII